MDVFRALRETTRFRLNSHESSYGIRGAINKAVGCQRTTVPATESIGAVRRSAGVRQRLRVRRPLAETGHGKSREAAVDTDGQVIANGATAIRIQEA